MKTRIIPRAPPALVIVALAVNRLIERAAAKKAKSAINEMFLRYAPSQYVSNTGPGRWGERK